MLLSVFKEMVIDYTVLVIMWPIMNGTRTNNHLVCKWTLNNLGKLDFSWSVWSRYLKTEQKKNSPVVCEKFCIK